MLSFQGAGVFRIGHPFTTTYSYICTSINKWQIRQKFCVENITAVVMDRSSPVPTFSPYNKTFLGRSSPAYTEAAGDNEKNTNDYPEKNICFS